DSLGSFFRTAGHLARRLSRCLGICCQLFDARLQRCLRLLGRLRPRGGGLHVGPSPLGGPARLRERTLRIAQRLARLHLPVSSFLLRTSGVLAFVSCGPRAAARLRLIEWNDPWRGVPLARGTVACAWDECRQRFETRGIDVAGQSAWRRGARTVPIRGYGLQC